MTTKHLSGYYSNGYTLAAGYTKLVIDRTADVRSDITDGVIVPFSATVVNQGQVYGGGAGVYLKVGGSLINGSTKDTSATIGGRYGGVFAKGPAAIANFGSIFSQLDDAGVDLDAGGTLTNGAGNDTTATIFGLVGVDALGIATVTNFGAISANDYYQAGAGVFLGAGGLITNGSPSDITASIRAGGYQNGVDAGAVATVENFGTIEAGLYDVAAVVLSGGMLTNGGAHDSTALIYGAYGVKASGAPTTIINFGTIEGEANYYSVALSGAGDEVIAEANSVFIGAIDGGGGVLALAGGGAGTISGLGHGGMLTGAVHARFIHFDTFVIEAGGTWTLAVSDEVDRGADLIDKGTLINSGFLTIAGTLSVAADAVFNLGGIDVSGDPNGASRIENDGLTIKNLDAGEITVAAHMYDRGVVEVASGTLDFSERLYGTGVLKIDAGATLEAAGGGASTLAVTFDGAGATLALARPNAFGATLDGLASGDIVDLLDLTATGASVNNEDQLVVVDGARTVATLQLSGAYGGATFVLPSDGHGGTDVIAQTVASPAAPIHAFINAMARLGARGGEIFNAEITAQARQLSITSPRAAMA